MASASTDNTTVNHTYIIPHLGGRIPERMVFAVIRNLGLGFLTKSHTITNDDGEEVEVKAVTLIPRQGQKGAKYQTAILSFDYMFTRGPRNIGNNEIIEHLDEPANSLDVIYQEAGYNKHSGRDEPARFWTMQKYTETHRQMLNSEPKGTSEQEHHQANKPRYELVTAEQRAQRRQKREHNLQQEPTDDSSTAPATDDEGFTTPGPDGKAK